MKYLKVVYVCPNNHRLEFSHLLDKRGKFDSRGAAACLSCSSSYNYAELIEPTAYFTYKLDLGSANGDKRKKALNA